MPVDKKRRVERSVGGEKLAEAILDGVQDAALVEKRRDQICDAALELFLRQGFAATTIRDICASSGVNQASIYDYIANKNDILRRLLNKLWFGPDMPTLAERLDQNKDVSFEESVAAYFSDTWSKKRKGTVLAYRSVPDLQEDDLRAMRARDRGVIEALAAQLRQRAGLEDGDPRAEVMANFIGFMAAFAPMRGWLTKDIDDQLILRTIASGVAAMLDRLAEDAAEERRGR